MVADELGAARVQAGAPPAAVVAALHVRCPAAVHEEGVAGFHGDPLCGRYRLELVSADRSVRRHVGLAAVAGHVEQDALGDDAPVPVGDVAEVGALGGDLDVGVAALPHAVLVPDVAEGVDVGHGRAVVDEAQVVHDVAAVPAERVLGDEVLRRLEDAAERDRPAGAHEAGGGGAFLGADEVDGAHLVVVAPAAPVAPVAVHRRVVGLGLGGCRGGRRWRRRPPRPHRRRPVAGGLAGQELRRREGLGAGVRGALGLCQGRGRPGQGGAAHGGGVHQEASS